MKRRPGFALGFVAGVVTCVAATALVAAYFVAQSWFAPLRMIEQITGFTVPGPSSLMYERSEHDGWFGDGYSLKVYTLPLELGRTLVADCPAGFQPAALADSGIPRPDIDSVEALQPLGCVFRRSKRDRTDTIVIAPDRIFHYSIDS